MRKNNKSFLIGQKVYSVHGQGVPVIRETIHGSDVLRPMWNSFLFPPLNTTT